MVADCSERVNQELGNDTRNFLRKRAHFHGRAVYKESRIILIMIGNKCWGSQMTNTELCVVVQWSVLADVITLSVKTKCSGTFCIASIGVLLKDDDTFCRKSTKSGMKSKSFICGSMLVCFCTGSISQTILDTERRCLQSLVCEEGMTVLFRSLLPIGQCYMGAIFWKEI